METIHYESVQNLLVSMDTWQLRGHLLERVELRDFLAESRSRGNVAHPAPAINYWGLHVVEGIYDGVLLDGLNALTVFETYPDRTDGRGTRFIYVDEQANVLQREALEAILGGHVGGGFALPTPWVLRQAGTRFVPIQWREQGDRKTLRVDEVHGAGVNGGHPRRAAHPPLPGASSLPPQRNGAAASGTLELSSDGDGILLSNVYWHGSINEC